MQSDQALYVVDIHQRYVDRDVNVPRVSTVFSLMMTAAAIVLVPVYQNAESLINLLQELYGLGSMPVLSAFALALLFNNVDYRAAMIGVVFGVAMYGLYTFWLNDAGIIRMHYIHFMAITFFTTVAFALAVNRIAFGKTATLRIGEGTGAASPAE